jgi:hypothetical protein
MKFRRRRLANAKCAVVHACAGQGRVVQLPCIGGTKSGLAIRCHCMLGRMQSVECTESDRTRNKNIKITQVHGLRIMTTTECMHVRSSARTTWPLEVEFAVVKSNIWSNEVSSDAGSNVSCILPVDLVAVDRRRESRDHRVLGCVALGKHEFV